MDQFKLSTRAYFRILKVARTIADFAGEEQIKSKHLLEAIAYRQRSHQC
jgi:magnesium chelatase family protein